ncbi:MAG: 50S ribosomal protein L17 [Candidatus Krumholzibacteriota bacterium]|nr:50S ribosomal protein L17 [Candidatus Krumholzibacteriota bacterium]
MRHRVDHRKLGRTAAHRRAMLNNMVTSLFAAERITTTDAKAKEARRLAERLITRAKKGHTAHHDGNTAVALAHWRQAARYVKKISILRKLFDEIAPHYLERPGGYTRIIRLGPRLGDNAQQVILELVDTDVTLKPITKTADAEGDSKDAKQKRSKEKPKKVAKEAKSKSKSKWKSKAKWRTKSKSKAKAKK